MRKVARSLSPLVASFYECSVGIHVHGHKDVMHFAGVESLLQVVCLLSARKVAGG